MQPTYGSDQPQPYYQDDALTLHHGDALDVARTLPSGSANCIVTSPPYFGLRDYGNEGQYGLEDSPAEYVETMRALFSELRRVLADDGTLWLNIGDSYNAYNNNRGPSKSLSARVDQARNIARAGLTVPSLPNKSLLGIPWRVAFALQDDGWILRQECIWAKQNCMPERVTDRPSRSHEQVFLFSKKPRYWYDADSIREDSDPEQGSGGRNARSVWTMTTQPFPGSHFAVFPEDLPRRCIIAGCKPGGTVLDPFSGSGTTGLVAGQLGRQYVGIDLSTRYLDMSLRTRLAQTALLDGGAA